MEIRPLDVQPPSSVTAGGGGALSGEPRAAEPRQAPQPPPTREAVQSAVDYVNAALAASNRGVEFSLDPDTRAIVVRVIDKQDNSVLRQMPSQEMLAIAKALDQLQGLLLRNRA